jgi:hypothetical protein
MKHAVVDELEHTENGVRYWTVRCECGRSFSSVFTAGLTPRRSARAAFRKHVDGESVSA